MHPILALKERFEATHSLLLGDDVLFTKYCIAPIYWCVIFNPSIKYCAILDIRDILI